MEFYPDITRHIHANIHHFYANRTHVGNKQGKGCFYGTTLGGAYLLAICLHCWNLMFCARMLYFSLASGGDACQRHQAAAFKLLLFGVFGVFISQSSTPQGYPNTEGGAGVKVNVGII